jgi:hypothetical protein
MKKARPTRLRRERTFRFYRGLGWLRGRVSAP